MEYEAKPDNRLWALIIIAAAIVPSLVAVELAVPGFQAHFSVAGSTPSQPSGPPPGGGVAVQVIMPSGVSVEHNLNFQPSSITLVVGKNNTVTWTNKDGADHTVTFLTGPTGVNLASISDADVGFGQTFTITLTVAGTYTYHCGFHPLWMRGTIVVKTA
jgi:plastocyanin